MTAWGVYLYQCRFSGRMFQTSLAVWCMLLLPTVLSLRVGRGSPAPCTSISATESSNLMGSFSVLVPEGCQLCILEQLKETPQGLAAIAQGLLAVGQPWGTLLPSPCLALLSFMSHRMFLGLQKPILSSPVWGHSECC